MRLVEYLLRIKFFVIVPFDNIYQTLKFFITKKTCKVIYFKVPSSVMFSYLDYDIVKDTSDIIERARLLTEHQISDFNQTRLILKLGWLIKDIREKGITTPFHLINSGKKYHCFIGTTRILVATYIEPVEFIEGYFLWYPDIDPQPFIIDYEHREITNPFEYLKLFKFGSTMISCIRLTDNLNVSDELPGITDKDTALFRSMMRNKYAQFRFAKECFSKTVVKFDVPFISFVNGLQWRYEIEHNIRLNDVIKFNGDECVFSDVKFKKINDQWITI